MSASFCRLIVLIFAGIHSRSSIWFLAGYFVSFPVVSLLNSLSWRYFSWRSVLARVTKFLGLGRGGNRIGLNVDRMIEPVFFQICASADPVDHCE